MKELNRSHQKYDA